MSKLIAEAITEYLGERCADFDADCLSCKTWAEYDALSQARAEGRREGLEEAAKVADEVAQNYQIKTDRKRFSESDVNRYMRGLVRMTSEDIRALAQKEGGKDG